VFANQNGIGRRRRVVADDLEMLDQQAQDVKDTEGFTPLTPEELEWEKRMEALHGRRQPQPGGPLGLLVPT
jgi:hypothetical protein